MLAPIVVKLGGSLGTSAHLPALLHEITAAANAGTRVVVVPGGGAFADAVRQVQADLPFSDRAAHDMALLAMAQTGLMLAALAPALRAVGGAAAVQRVLASARTGDPALIWLPDPLRDAPEVEHSWRMTADSLALWLAAQIGARRVVLVKTCPAPASCELGALSATGIVDALYPEIAARSPAVATALVFDADASALRAALAANN